MMTETIQIQIEKVEKSKLEGNEDGELNFGKVFTDHMFIADFKDGKNKENVVNKSKTTGEPPLMNAMSVFFAIKDAISSVGNYDIPPIIDAPATPEKILMSLKNLKKVILTIITNLV